MDNDVLPREMFEHYGQTEEATRLLDGSGELEKVRTWDILNRHLPRPPAVVLDIGGAAGVHALWLARKGYEVHLVDPVPHHVEQALAASNAQPDHQLASCEIGDGRRVEKADGCADAVLLLGPMYHLTNRADRLQALREVYRVLRPGGVLFCAAISRFASLLDGLSRDRVSDPDFVEILRRDLQDGQHRNPTGNREYFTTTFFHHPRELHREIEDAGLRFDKTIGIEGPVWWMANFSHHWGDPAKRELLLGLLEMVEEDPSLIGASAHLMGIARKPQ